MGGPMYCSSCGGSVAETARFCASCGSQQTATTVLTDEAPSSPAPSVLPGKRSGPIKAARVGVRILVALGAVVLVAAAIPAVRAAVLNDSSSASRPTSRSFSLDGTVTVHKVTWTNDQATSCKSGYGDQ